MVQIVRPFVSVAVGIALGVPAAAHAQADLFSGGDPAGLVSARWGDTPRGATRVVFEVSRVVDFLTVELPHENGFEVHLLNTQADPLPDPLRVDNGRIVDVTFRPGPSGTVARIAGGAQRLRAMTFTLENPARVVVDVTIDTDDPFPTAAPPTTVASPSEARKRPRAADAKPELAVPSPDPAPVTVADAGSGGADPEADAEAEADDVVPATPESAAVEAPADAEFDELLAWLTGVRLDAAALQLSESEEDRARYRRSLSFLLAQRGLVHEAVKMLSSALESEGYDQGTAFADSAYLAELKFRTGDRDGASELAQALSAADRTPPQRLRLARILSECDFDDLARMHLDEALPRLTGQPRLEGQLLMARVYWDKKDPGKALAYVRKVTDSKYAPEEILGSALILQADCIWALGRPAEAEALYRRSLALALTDEESSWVTLQLGNLAYRQGRPVDAMDHYRRARDTWPDTFFGTQADWFLRLAERTEQAETADAANRRG